MADKIDKVQEAKDFIVRIVDLFGAESCCLSFNGGKDSTVLLHLIREALPHRYAKIKYVYFEQSDEFEEVENFIDDISLSHGIQIMYPKGSFKDGLQNMIDESGIKHIFIGTRRTDPNGTTLERLHITDGSWPNCVRIHPIIDWDYTEVWEYLQGPTRTYCQLYDQGYTSLGSKSRTILNDKLILPDGTYAPARALTDGRFERTNRSNGPSSSSTSTTVCTNTKEGVEETDVSSDDAFNRGVVMGIAVGGLWFTFLRQMTSPSSSSPLQFITSVFASS